MTELEKYYNEQFRDAGDPEFNKLDQGQKTSIANSLAFAYWKRDHVAQNFKQAFYKEFIPTVKPLFNQILPFVIVYLCFAFVLWDFNPGNWHEAARFICVVLAISGTIIHQTLEQPT
jgi:hypothetical protein